MVAPQSFSPASSEPVSEVGQSEATVAAKSQPLARQPASLPESHSGRQWECPLRTPSLPEETQFPRNSQELRTLIQSGKARGLCAASAPTPRVPAYGTARPPAAEYPA